MNDGMKMLVAAGIGFLVGVLGTVFFQQAAARGTLPLEQVNQSTITPGPSAMEDAMTADWQNPVVEQNDSGQNGTVVLSEEDGKTKVVINLTAAPGASVSASQPAHIHDGSCPTPGAVKYPLTNVVNGKSETIIDTTIDQLKSSLPLAVNVHKSPTEIAVYTACGDLK